jgi:hypothetical protein
MPRPGAGIVGDVLPRKQRHGEVVTFAGQRMRASHAGEKLDRHIAHFFISRNTRLLEDLIRELVRKDHYVAGLHPVVGRRVGNAVDAIIDLRRKADCAIAGQRPGRRGPDDDAGAPVGDIHSQCRRIPVGRRLEIDRGHWKFHPDLVTGVVLVLDFRFGERGLLHHAPHHRL